MEVPSYGYGRFPAMVTGGSYGRFLAMVTGGS